MKYQMLYRPVYEFRSAVMWAIASIYCAAMGAALRLSATTVLALALSAGAMALWRGNQARRLWEEKLLLMGKQFQFIDAVTVREAMPSIGENLWLGWGWRWQPSHTQKAIETMERDLHEIYPPAWVTKYLFGREKPPAEEKGLQWVHGLDDEKDVLIPLSALDGHTWIAATTGAIKTTLFGLLLAQFALRGETVIIFDPKGDKDLEAMARQCAAWSGDPDRFVKLHPAFPTQSCRFDALKNWDRDTQPASRIQMLMSSGEDDSFLSFCWLTITNITSALKYTGKRPTLKTFIEVIQSVESAGDLLEQALRMFFQKNVPGWEALVAERATSGDRGNKKGNQTTALSFASDNLVAMIELYDKDVPEHMQRPEISGLIAMLRNNREWFGKMIIQLVPLLTKLTTGDLDSLLSPKYDDIKDERPIYDMRSIIEGKKIFYIGLDALSDKSVAVALAALLLSDAAAVGGELYNYSTPEEMRSKGKINFLLDEWGDLLCEPVIQMANKTRGAGYRLFLAGQSFSDAVDKMGTLPKAERVVANLNNVIAGANNDKKTIDQLMDKVGETYIQRASYSKGTGQKTEDTGLEYSANRGTSLSSKESVLIPRSLYSALADLHYIAVVNRGEVIKGRIPKVMVPQ